MNAKDNLIDFDIKHIWHPAAQMKDYESFPPVPVVRGKGCYLFTEDGHEILDIISSWWCNLLGHCNEEISDALCKQAKTLEHVIFANFTHPWVVELTEELLSIVPKGITHFNYGDNGSSSVEMALKIAFQYQQQIGQTNRRRFACLSEGYHGETIGALSVGSMDLYNLMYKPMMMDNIHIEAPDLFLHPEDYPHKCMERAEKVFEEHGSELCALIVEPLLQGAGGMRIYPAEYLKFLSDLCKKHGVLLIADEIATGFGRTGKWFACDHAGITPDLMCMSKAITGGYMPMSVVGVTDQVYDAFLGEYSEGKAFLHSHTYAGNPLACACALSVIRILKRDHIIEKACETAQWLSSSFAQRFSSLKNVGQVRSIGLINVMEIVKDKTTKERFPSSLRLGYRIYQDALKEGLLLRPIGDTLYFNPPLNISKEDLTKAMDITYKVLTRNLENMS
ncbi:adenosylmethionine--8-amino-7-oxononanoate transaminase [Succinivibrio dextrinosolvens]|uniref:adenosylmethionine--8-amino-7-oxononanoate transaminase n=1 Tax=Succinivibrio dextrinosolvens TaxID=83771 RepID=UPI0024786897|nr:adenosylmethionine--8-amino-7-oxononanoate transaminase [Succinivibrio dextrinosolvens]